MCSVLTHELYNPSCRSAMPFQEDKQAWRQVATTLYRQATNAVVADLGKATAMQEEMPTTAASAAASAPDAAVASGGDARA